MGSQNQILLSIDSVSKYFAGVTALDGVSFQVKAGEVHALVGENGAGKSTLMGVASGALTADKGQVHIAGTPMHGDPELARELGLAIVRQEPALMPDLSVAENLYLGVPSRCRPLIGESVKWAEALLKTWSDDAGIDVRERVASLGPEQRFIVEIVKALAADPKILVLDEPTEHLLADDVARLFERIRAVTARGACVIYISHRIREVQQIADRLTVLRDGQGQGTYDASTMDEERIVELIVGVQLDREFPSKATRSASRSIVLDVNRLRGDGFHDVSLQVRQGEMVGLAGISDNGQREFMRALAGIQRSKGTVTLKGAVVRLGSSAQASEGGIRYLTGDRHREGIFAELSVRENYSIRSLGEDLVSGLLSGRREERRAKDAVKSFVVKTPGIETPIGSLSGGNQQKLVLASVLASKPKVLLVDEPTQGVDVGARMSIYKTLRDVANSGVAVIVLSSDAQEVAGLCDRVAIFSRGQIVKELDGDEVVEGNITSAVLTSTTTRSRDERQEIGTFWKWASGDWAPVVMITLAILGLGIFANHVNDFYLSGRNLSGMMALIATLAIVAFGQQLLMLVGGIDLSVGPLMGLVVVIQSFFLTTGATTADHSLGWVLTFSAGLAVGVLNWILVDPLKLHPMVATLSTFMGIQAVALMLRPTPDGLISDGVMEGIGLQWGYIPVVFVVVAVGAVCLERALFSSRWGVALRGLGSRPEAARVAGIHPRLSNFVAYVGCSFFACLAAIPLLSQVGTGDANAGTNYTLSSIAAVVIGGASLFGGRGSFVGALLGAMLITQVNVVTNFLGVTDAWQSYLLGAMILASVAVYSKSRQMVVAK
jgi:ribose transport system ATP-binding protein